MADPERNVTSAMAWWGVVRAAASEHLPTAELWDRIHAETQRQGWVEPPNLLRQINDIRAAATSLQYAKEHLSSLPPEATISRLDMAFLPYGRKEGQPVLVRQYDVRVAFTRDVAGQLRSDYLTLRYSQGQLPATVGELRDQAYQLVAAKVKGYGDAVAEFGDIEIGEL